MRLTVLGNTRRYLAPRSGGTGYLLETEGKRILLDCGGTIADALDPAPLDAIVISHFHHDHVLDLLRLRDSLPEGMPIVIPAGERERFAQLGAAFAFRGPFKAPGPLIEAVGEQVIAGVPMRFAPTQHSAPSFATRIHGFTYASDTAACDALRDLARGSDLLLMHTLLATVDPASSHAKRHATARTAGELAREAGVKKLCLSHRHHETRDEDVLREAQAAFPSVLLAETRDSYAIPS